MAALAGGQAAHRYPEGLLQCLVLAENGQVVGAGRVEDMTKDEVLGMIILGKCPPGATPGPGAMAA